METAPNSEWTHEEVITGARRALVEELGIAGSDLAEAFVVTPIGPRVRAGGVRTGLARLAVERVAVSAPGIRFGGYNDVSDEVTILLLAAIAVREGLELPVLSPVLLKLVPFLFDLLDRGA